MRPKTDQEIIDVLERLEAAPKLVSERIGQTREQVQDDVKAYISDKLAASYGHITPEVLQTADRLYDLRGMPKALTESLHLEAGELAKLLGRNITLTCSNCGRQFDTFARRVRYGYSEKSPQCEDCRKNKREDNSLAYQRELEAIQLKAAVDKQLSTVPDPYLVPQYSEHLRGYLAAWLNRSAPRPLTNANLHLVRGCFICGLDTVRFGVSRETALDAFDGLATYVRKWLDPPLRAGSSANRVQWVQLSTLAQALWRIDASEYFDHFAQIPILALPIVLLCRYCWDSLGVGLQFRELQEGAEYSLRIEKS